MYQVWYDRYHVSFYLRLIGSVVKHCKILKNYDQGCLKTFFLLFTLLMMIQISRKKYAILVQKSSAKKLPISNSERFLEAIFDLN